MDCQHPEINEGLCLSDTKLEGHIVYAPWPPSMLTSMERLGWWTAKKEWWEGDDKVGTYCSVYAPLSIEQAGSEFAFNRRKTNLDCCLYSVKAFSVWNKVSTRFQEYHPQDMTMDGRNQVIDQRVVEYGRAKLGGRWLCERQKDRTYALIIHARC